jgi:hypothetical protein
MPEAPAFTPGRPLQSWPQAPQFRASDVRSTHIAPQASGAVLPQLAMHAGAPPVAPQSGAGAVQAWPQPPQVCASARLASQPSSGRAEQCAKPAAQAGAGTEQTPELQWTTAPGATLGSAPQSCPQVPQFLGSEDRFTQLVPQVSGLVAAQVALHFGPVLELVHRGAAPEHFVPQPPQVCASVRLASQPSSAREEQCA